MFTNLIVRLVDACRRQAIAVIIAALAITVLLGAYVASTIRINTDINQLLASDLAWRQREQTMERLFPQNVDRLVVVVEGSTPDIADNAVTALAAEMKKHPDVLKNVKRPDSIPFFRQNGFLFLETDELNTMLESLIQAQPVLGSIAADPSLRGLFNTLNMVLLGLKENQFDYSKIDRPLTVMADTIDSTLNGKPQVMPWQQLMSDKEPTLRSLQKIILTQPVLNYNDLSPGKAASNLVRQLAKDLNLTPDNGVRVRLTGSVALNDDEFASVADGAVLGTLLSFVLVLVLLFMALRSIKLVLPILITLICGLIATTAFAMAAIGSLNLISVAFAVMFVGMAVDFGIQVSTCYREQRYRIAEAHVAMTSMAKTIAVPLSMAAATTTLGFLAFMPTDYRGVAELGLIASAGMIIAFILNITLLPALLSVFKPKAEPESIGYAWAAPLDLWILKHRQKILKTTALITLIALGFATQLRFDADPLNLKNHETESVSTLFDLMKDPQATIYTMEIMAPSLQEADVLASQIKKLPEVHHVMTLSSFTPEDQNKKLAMIDDANMLLAPTLSPLTVLPEPSDEETLSAIQKTIDGLKALTPAQASTNRLITSLQAVVDKKDPALLKQLHQSILSGMILKLQQIRDALGAIKVTPENITEDLAQDWITPEGAKIQVFPNGNARDPDVLQAFTVAVKSIAPEASGTPISILESGKTISGAFVIAALYAILAISLLVWTILKRFDDVIRLLTPLLLAGILTLASMTVLGIPLNFANIIALPLLLSLGVSYSIYFVSYWRAGSENPLQSSMARAVLFSAATTLVAFGTLSLSSHPGTRSMGDLLTIALLYCLICTFFVLPALLGRPKMD